MVTRLSIAASLLLAACGSYANSKIVKVDGVEHEVRQLPGVETWQAFLNRPSWDDMLGSVNARLQSNNVKAIELATGCTVDPMSVRHTMTNITSAAVNC